MARPAADGREQGTGRPDGRLPLSRKASLAFKHAFAVDEAGSLEPTQPQRAVVDKVCQAIVRRRLTTPAMLVLEMGQPLNYVTSQTLHFFAPLVSVVTDAQGYRHFAAFLERRESVDYLRRRLDELEAAAQRRESPQAQSGAGPTAAGESPASARGEQGAGHRPGSRDRPDDG